MAFESADDRNGPETEALRNAGDGWLRPDRGVGASAPHRPFAALYELRPLSLGEILDRTFALYRSHFWLFAGIAAVSASVGVVVQAISLATSHAMMRRLALGPTGAAPAIYALHGYVGAQLGTWAAALAFFLVAAIANAATTLALSEVYRNRPTGAGKVLAVAFKRPFRWIGIGLWQTGSMLWIFLLAVTVGLLCLAYGTRVQSTAPIVIGSILAGLAVLAGLPAGLVLYLRNCLAIPAAMVESLPISAAMRRSKVLAAGAKGRIFVVLLITGVLYMVVAVLESPASYLMLVAPKQEHYIAQAITLLVSFLGHTLVAPVGLIGLTLLYFDERVRKEALDLRLLLEGTRAGSERPGVLQTPGIQTSGVQTSGVQTSGTPAAAASTPPPAPQEFTSLD